VNGEGGIGAAEEDYGYLRGDLVTGFDFYRGQPYFSPNIDVPLGSIYNTIAAGIAAATPPELPQVVPVPEIFPTVEIIAPTTGTEEVLQGSDVGVIDPESEPKYTVWESEAEWIPIPVWPQNVPATDWDKVYDEYVVLNDETVQQAEEPMAGIDWGEVISTVATGLFQPGAAVQGAYSGIAQFVGPPTPVGGPPPTISPSVSVGGAAMTPGGTCGPVGPRYGKICLATGEITPLRRRRRRRLLTSSDLADLAALKAIVGGGANMNQAVVKAVRR